LHAGGGGVATGAAGDAGKYKDFTVQYAKSGKSICRGCENKIDKVRQQTLVIPVVIVTFSSVDRPV